MCWDGGLFCHLPSLSPTFSLALQALQERMDLVVEEPAEPNFDPKKMDELLEYMKVTEEAVIVIQVGRGFRSRRAMSLKRR
jgi:hypothetical protein